ncbi:site-specific integrase [Dechloromonas sp. ZS-1]|uniref:tyrosine-type recombinase/integrase n=1 Tax=Dechloromonas sp. ZS-1 TaxID=3138067 RepID=UPI0031FD75EA
MQAIRTFFAWLVNVRYLAGNPWITVSDPAVAQALTPIQIDKALTQSLWQKLTDPGGILDQLCAQSPLALQQRYKMRGAAAEISLPAQYRLVRAALLLLGTSGVRREEAAYATRDKLKPVPGEAGLWEMDVLGKRAKWRTVFLPLRTVTALQQHWADRALDFSFGLADLPLLSPLVTPAFESAQQKHRTPIGDRRESGFSQDGLYRVIKTALRRISEDDSFDLDPAERAHLRQAGPHAFRHTFGTQAVAGEVPLDVLQRVLGHANLQTTTIYVQAEKKRSIAELGKFFQR